MSNSQIVETSRQYKDAKTMQGFMKGHMFVYTLKYVLVEDHICDSEKCLAFTFE